MIIYKELLDLFETGTYKDDLMMANSWVLASANLICRNFLTGAWERG